MCWCEKEGVYNEIFTPRVYIGGGLAVKLAAERDERKRGRTNSGPKVEEKKRGEKQSTG